MTKFKDLLARLPRGYLGASSKLTGWLLIRAGSQALMTIVIAKALGASDYGSFVTIIALASFFAPLAGFGLHGVILIRGARTPGELPRLIGACLTLWAASTCLFSLLAITVVFHALPSLEHSSAVALLVFAEVVSTSLAELIARIEQSRQNIAGFGTILSCLAAIRLLVALPFLLYHSLAFGDWIIAYTSANLIFSAAISIWLFRHHQVEKPSCMKWHLLREGLPFGIGAASMRLQGEFNKPLLAQIHPALAGNLNVAQRSIDLVSLPLMALQETLWPRFYANANPLKQMRLFLAGILIIAIGLGATLSLVAPLLPIVLGSDYQDSASMLLWLAWLPCLLVLRNLANALVVARGYQVRLTGVYIFSASAGIILNLWLIPEYAALGAIVAAYLSEALTLLTLLTILIRYPHRSPA